MTRLTNSWEKYLYSLKTISLAYVPSLHKFICIGGITTAGNPPQWIQRVVHDGARTDPDNLRYIPRIGDGVSRVPLFGAK